MSYRHLLALFACTLPAWAVTNQTEALMTNTLTLRTLATRAGVDIGGAVAPGPLQNNPRYAALAARECTVLVAENHMKMRHTQPARGTFDFTGADVVMAFARTNGMRVRGHTLVWHAMPPAWLETTTWTRAELLAVMRTHITTVMQRYKGHIHAWDVVNEALDDKGGLPSSLWHNVIGPEYLDLAFTYAHAADPSAMLFYNDYSAEGLNKKSDEAYALVRGMQARGVPVHGVGLQCHWRYDNYPSLADVVSNITRLAALGLEVHITELDLRIDLPVTPDKLARQARAYGEIVRACLTAP